MNLATTYMGLQLRSPLVPSASPLSESLDNLKRMEDAGASAVVFHSLFEEQLRHTDGTLLRHLTHDASDRSAIPGYFPEAGRFHTCPEEYLTELSRAKEALGIPVIASLNGTSFGGWTTCARDIEQAGADALELNIYTIPTDPDLSADEIEMNYASMLAALKGQVKIPIALKLSPFFTNFARFACLLDRHHVDGLVLFNRFYQPDIDLAAGRVSPTIHLSTSNAARLPLRWIAILHGRVHCSLAATSGIHHGSDVLKMIMAGADIAMLCSVLLRNGIGQIRVIEQEMVDWMTQHGYDSIESLKGCFDQRTCADPSAFERAQYIRALAVDRAIVSQC